MAVLIFLKDQKLVFEALAAVLHIGNITFKADATGEIAVC